MVAIVEIVILPFLQMEILWYVEELQTVKLQIFLKTDWQMHGFAKWKNIENLINLANAVSVNLSHGVEDARLLLMEQQEIFTEQTHSVGKQ